jgi:hypothetical protein
MQTTGVLTGPQGFLKVAKYITSLLGVFLAKVINRDSKVDQQVARIEKSVVENCF